MKILIRHSLKYLENNTDLDKKLKNQVESTLLSVNKEELDLSKIDLLSLDSDIIKSIIILFKNLILIKRKCLLTTNFKKFLIKTTGSDDINDFRTYYNEFKRYRKLKVFKENAVNAICSGKILK